MPRINPIDPNQTEGNRCRPCHSITLNVRFGSKADIQRHSHLCPLLGAKRTLDVCFFESEAFLRWW